MAFRGWSTPDRIVALFTALAFGLSSWALYYTHRRSESSDSFAAEELLNRAWREVRHGDLDSASDLIYLAGLKKQTFRGWAYRGYLQYARGNAAPSLPYFERALEREPDYAVGLIFLADARAKSRQFDAASEHLEKALTLATANDLQDVRLISTVHLSLGNLRRRQGSPQDAIFHYLEACRIDPANIVAQLALADAQFEVGDVESALTGYDRVLQREPTVASHWLAIGELLLLLDEHRAAEHAIRRYLELEPRRPGQDLLAQAVRRQGREEEADRILEQSWRLSDLR